MPNYRIYLMNEVGRISAGDDTNCDNDTKARELALRMVAGGIQAEVWCGTRPLGRVSRLPEDKNADLAKDWELNAWTDI